MSKFLKNIIQLSFHYFIKYKKETIVTITVSVMIFLIIPVNFAKFPVSSAAFAIEDETAPQVTAFNLTPDTVDTGSAEATLTLTLTLTDDNAGVCIAGDCEDYYSSETQFRLLPTNGTQWIDFYSFTRISGDDLNGTYAATATLPQYSMNGIWSAYSLLLVDKLGNNTSLYKEDLEALFGDGVTDVQNTATVYDDAQPEITAFQLSPQTINTDEADVEVTLAMTLTDEYAGVCIPGDCNDYISSATQLRLKAPSGSQMIDFADFTRTAGNDLNGTYESTATFPRGSMGGTWTADYLFVNDKIGNNEFLSVVDIEALFGDGATDIVNTGILNDEEQPNITAFEITPTEINTSETSQTLTLRVTLTDNQSGVCIAGDCGDYNSSETQLRLTPLIGTQYIDFTNLTRLSGDELSGEYEATATFPKSSKEGVWQVEYLLLVDKIGNNEFLYADDLNSLFPGASGLTISNTTELSSVEIEREWTFSSDRATVTFPKGTIVTKKEGGVFAFYKMVNEEFNIEEVINNNLSGKTVLAVRFGIPGLNLEFSQAVTVAFNVGEQYNGEILQIQTLEEGGTAWANEKQCTVADGLCSFTVNHASYFAANLINRLIITGAGPGGGPQIRGFSVRGIADYYPNNLFAYSQSFHGGVRVATGDIDRDGKDEIITGAGPGGGPQVRIFEKNGTPRGIQLFPFPENYRGGVDVASGDFDGDGKDDIAVSQFSGAQGWVKVYRYNSNQTILFEKNVFGDVKCGATVAMGDVDLDGRDELIVGAGNGGGPQGLVFDYKAGDLNGTQKPISFFAFDPNSRTGVDVAAGDVNGDGKAEIVVSVLKNGQARIKVYRYNTQKTIVGEWVAYGLAEVGANVSLADIDGDSRLEVVTGAGPTGGPQVRAFEADGDPLTLNFFAYGENFRGGVDVAGGLF